MAFEVLPLGQISTENLSLLAKFIKDAENYIPNVSDYKPEMVLAQSNVWELNTGQHHVHTGTVGFGKKQTQVTFYEKFATSGVAVQVASKPKAKHGFTTIGASRLFKAIDFDKRQGNICAFSFRLITPHGSNCQFGEWKAQGLWFENNKDAVLWKLENTSDFSDPTFGQTPNAFLKA